MRSVLLGSVVALALTGVAPGMVRAAAVLPSITIDDSDPNTITFNAVGLTNLTIDGNAVGSLPQTFADGTVHSFAGSWTFGSDTVASTDVTLFFSTNATDTMSGTALNFAGTNGDYTIFLGVFVGYDGTWTAGNTPQFPQDGSTQFANLPGLTLSFTSEKVGGETPVPEPASLALLGAGLLGLGAARRRR